MRMKRILVGLGLTATQLCMPQPGYAQSLPSSGIAPKEVITKIDKLAREGVSLAQEAISQGNKTKCDQSEHKIGEIGALLTKYKIKLSDAHTSPEINALNDVMRALNRTNLCQSIASAMAQPS